MSRFHENNAMTWIVCVGLLAIQWPTTTLIAQELLGAKAVLQKLRNDGGMQDQSRDVVGLTEAIRELPKQLEGLAPADAAKAWIAVYDKWRVMPDKEKFPHSMRLKKAERTEIGIETQLPS